MKTNYKNGQEYNLLSCVKCGTLLVEKSAEYFCSECQSFWLKREGVPVFVAKNKDYAFYNRIDKEEFPNLEKELLQFAKESNWEKAVINKFNSAKTKKEKQFIYHYNLDSRKAAWQLLLPINHHTHVLEYGCGYGVTALNLARRCQQVVAMDLTYERVKFIQIRAEQMGLKNITTIWGGDNLPLPFLNSQFDIISMNGVLEWVALGQEGDPEAIQRNYISEMYRLLKKDAYLYIGIENRYGYNYIFGRRDPHTQLRFVTLLPRTIANIYSRLIRGVDFREYTYSINQLKKLLADSGFCQIEFYAIFPDYNNPYFVINLDEPQSLKFFIKSLLKSRNTLERILKFASPLALKMGLFQQTVPAFIILAKKGK